jgi:hypothetical protein
MHLQPHKKKSRVKVKPFITTPTVVVGARPVSDIPSLNAASQSGYVVTGDAQWSNGAFWAVYYPYRAPQGTLCGYLTSSSSNCTLDLQLPVAKAYDQFSWSAPALTYNRLNAFRIYGSNDGTTWVELLNVSGVTAAMYPTDYSKHLIIQFNNNTPYLRYRVRSYSILGGSFGVYIQEATWATRT